MSQTQFSLLGKRRFLPFFVTQSLGAFNGNGFEFLDCPSEDQPGSNQGGARVTENPALAGTNDSFDASLHMWVPTGGGNALIQHSFEFVDIEAGDRLRTTVSCQAAKQTCDARVQIPMQGGVDSLNAAASSAVLLHALRLGRTHFLPK